MHGDGRLDPYRHRVRAQRTKARGNPFRINRTSATTCLVSSLPVSLLSQPCKTAFSVSFLLGLPHRISPSRSDDYGDASETRQLGSSRGTVRHHSARSVVVPSRRGGGVDTMRRSSGYMIQGTLVSIRTKRWPAHQYVTLGSALP